jgi:hypothetical protein
MVITSTLICCLVFLKLIIIIFFFDFYQFDWIHDIYHTLGYR